MKQTRSHLLFLHKAPTLRGQDLTAPASKVDCEPRGPSTEHSTCTEKACFTNLSQPSETCQELSSRSLMLIFPLFFLLLILLSLSLLIFFLPFLPLRVISVDTKNIGWHCQFNNSFMCVIRNAAWFPIYSKNFHTGEMDLMIYVTLSKR